MRRARPHRALAPVLAVAAVFAASAARAQTTTVDQGVFQIEIDGRRIGTETFSIERRGRGDAITTIARGRVLLDGGAVEQEITTSLEAEGPALRPSNYRVIVRGPRSERIAGRLVGRRFSARIVSSAGERMREYLADQGAIVVEEGVLHHHYFLARRVDAGTRRVPVIIPRENRQATATVATDGPATIEIGGRRVRTQRLVVELEGAPVRHLWVDDQARVLRVAVPAQNYTAERTAPPR